MQVVNCFITNHLKEKCVRNRCLLYKVATVTIVSIALIISGLLFSGAGIIGGEDSNLSVSALLTTMPTLQVHYIDVGQGDSILLDLGTTEVLIDGGKTSPGVVPYLQQYVDGSLEVVIATHPDADHIGGLIDVLDSFSVEQIWTNGQAADTATYTNFMGRVNAEGADIHVARRGDTITASNLTFEVLSPVEPFFSGTNENSIVLSLSYGSEDFIFTGDAGTQAEARMISAGVLQQVEILKVGHHGSSSATSQAFLDIVQPEVAIYMAGVGNPYGHPSPVTISALQAIGAQIYGTDTCGTITVTTDGNSYAVSTAQVCTTPTPTPSLTPTPTPTPTAAPTPTPTPSPTGSTPVTGITREVNGDILPGVSITLDGAGAVVSDQSGHHEIMATTTGSNNVVAHKDGFRDRTRTINITGLGTGYAVTCNFQGQYGLIPKAPDIWYALDCVNLWLYPPNPDTGLDIWTALDVINAWLYPVQ